MRDGDKKKFLPQKSCATGVKKSFYPKNHAQRRFEKVFTSKIMRDGGFKKFLPQKSCATEV
jgi:hypothetical protein